MSIKWMSYIWEERTDLKGSELYCAIAIADHADGDGRCFPGIKTIAMKMRLKERQVQDLIKRLEEKNVFDIERGNGRGNLTIFKFKRVQDSTPFEESKRVQDSAIKGAGFCKKRVQDSAFPIYKEEPLKEPRGSRAETTAAAATRTPHSFASTDQAAEHLDRPFDTESEVRTSDALTLYREFYPATFLSPYQTDLIHDTPRFDKESFRSALLYWKGKNNRANNIDGLLDFYSRQVDRTAAEVAKQTEVRLPTPEEKQRLELETRRAALKNLPPVVPQKQATTI